MKEESERRRISISGGGYRLKWQLEKSKTGVKRKESVFSNRRENRKRDENEEKKISASMKPVT